MEKSKFFLLFIIINVIFLNSSFSQDIPIIVISPGKTIQSYSTTGSAVSVIDSDDIEESQDYFLADVLNNNSTGINLFQMGGQGTNAGIQSTIIYLIIYLVMTLGAFGCIFMMKRENTFYEDINDLSVYQKIIHYLH